METRAHLVHREGTNNYFRRGLRRERVIRSRLDPLQIYDVVEPYQRFRLNGRGIVDLTDMLRDDLDFFVSQKQCIIARVTGPFDTTLSSHRMLQSLDGDMINVHPSTACLAIHRIATSTCRRSFPI